MILLLFSFINLSNSYFNFTIQLYSSTDSWNIIRPELTFKSNTELNVNAFIYKTSPPASPITIQRKGSNQYYINFSGYENGTLNIIINTPLISLNEMFINVKQIKKIKLISSGENVQYMESTFENCTSLASVDLTEFDLSNVISFKRTFFRCALSHVEFGNSTIANVINMGQMFYSCSLSTLDLSVFDTSKVTDMNGLFYGHKWVSLNLKSFNTSLVRNFSYMFSVLDYLTNLEINNFDTSKGLDMSYMFSGCRRLSFLNVSNFDTSLVTSMDYMFKSCGNLTSLDLSNFNTSSVKSMNYMLSLFYTDYCCFSYSLIRSLDLSNFNTSLVTSMKGMFYRCRNLVKLNIKSFDTSSVTDMSYMFYECKFLTSLDISNLNGEKVTNTSHMFRDCNYLTSLDFDNFKMTEIKDMEYMFYKCILLKSLNLVNFDTSLTTNMAYMFYECKLLSFLNINNFNTSKVTDMNYMFSGCLFLASLNLSKFEISQYTTYNKILNPISDNMIYCIREEVYDKIKTEIEEKRCSIKDNNCFNGWSKKSYKYIEGTDKCIEDCNLTENYKYEYRGNCYSSCPPGTTSLYNNDFLCEDFKEEKFIINEEIKKNISQRNTESITEEINLEKTQKVITDDIKEDIKTNKIIIEHNENYLFKVCQPIDFFKKECKPIKYDSSMINMIKHSINDGLMDDLLEEVINESKIDIYNTDSDIKYQITSSFNQNNKNYENISVINLTQCESKLKQIYDINPNDTLIIFKYDYKIEGLLIPIVGYEVFHPITKEILNLSLCNEEPIDLILPINIDENKLYKHDPNTDYYKDKCNSFPNEKGVDMTLYERKKEYNDKNLSLCPNNCDFTGYDNSTKKAKCQCEPQFNSSLINLDNIINKKKLLNNFKDIKKASNIGVIKCYKRFFSKEGFKKNIGSYIILIIVLIFLVGLITFILKGYKILNGTIDNIIKSSEEKKKIKFTQNEPVKKKQIKIIHPQTKTKIKKKKNKYRPITQNKSINLISNSEDSYEKKGDAKSQKNENLNMSFISADKINKKDNKNKKDKKGIIKNNKNKNEIKFNDSELNSFEYKYAQLFDKRNYSEYYLSLIMTRHPLISSFYPKNKYNSNSIKICLLFLSFASSLTVNSLFFTDETMHKIYEDEGIFNFVYSLPKIIYSTLISTVISIIINKLALTEDEILNINKEKNSEEIKARAEKTKKYLLIKFILFFIIGFILLGIYWFYIGCFCAVYINTQYYLLKDTMISFSFSLIIPFIKYLMPCMIRQLSLTKPGQCLYDMSKILQ